MKNITTRRQLLAQLRKLGYQKSAMQMTRNATTYSKGGRLTGSRLVISVGSNGQFIIQDRVQRPNDWGFMSMMLNVGNMRAGATVRLDELLRQLQEANIPLPEPFNEFDLALALARGAERDSN